MNAEQLAAKKIREAARTLRINQDRLKVRLDGGDSEVSICKCGKYFSNVCHGTMAGKTRKYCVRCPLKPATRIKMKFSKKQEIWIPYNTKW